MIERCGLQQFTPVENHLWLLEHIHIGEPQLKGGATGMQQLYGAERRMQSGHSGGMEADAAGVDAMNGSQPFTNPFTGEGSLLRIRRCFQAENDRCLARGCSESGVLPEGFGVGRGRRIRLQADQCAQGSQLRACLRRFSLAVVLSSHCRGFAGIGPGA